MKTLYENTAKLYDRRHENDTTRHLRKREKEMLRKYMRGLVLDIGCGTGEYANIPQHYVGIDTSRKMIAEARNKTKKTFVIAAAENLPFTDDSFDTTICMFTVLNLCDCLQAVKEMHRVLKKNGVAIVSVASVWDRKNYSLMDKIRGRYDSDVKNVRIEKNKLKFKLFTKKELIAIFENAGFRLQEFHGIYKWQEPYWNRYARFGLKEKAEILLENVLPAQIGRIYIAVFTKV